MSNRTPRTPWQTQAFAMLRREELFEREPGALLHSAGTLEKYQDAMGWVIRWLGDIAPQRITQQHILLIKAQCAKRNIGASRISHILSALKSFLRFCQLTGSPVTEIQRRKF